MHPELVRALAKGRHEDLLNTYPVRGEPRIRPVGRLPLFSRSRHWLGALLIRAGARLTADRRAPLDLAHE